MPEINLNDPKLKEFEVILDEQFKLFGQELGNKFKKFKEEYTAASKDRMDIQDREIRAKIESNTQKIDGLNEQQSKLTASTDSLFHIIERFVSKDALKYAKWKALQDWRKVLNDAKTHNRNMIYSGNFFKRKAMRKCFIAWRFDSHVSIKEKIRKEYVFQQESRKVEIGNKYDPQVVALKNEVDVAKSRLADIIRNKEMISEQYDLALKRGMTALSKETVPISSSKKLK